MSELKWLHLSDFHFGKKPYSTYQQPLVARKLIEHVIARSTKEGGPDLVFITGDIANSGQSSEYALFNDHVIFPLLAHFGDDFIDNIFLVPGNHDVQREVQRNFGRNEHLSLDSGNFEPTAESLKDRADLVERLKGFITSPFASELSAFEGKEGVYRRELNFGEKKVGILGINTSWLCRDNNDKGMLTPGVPIIRDALEQGADCDLTFVLGHHPLDWYSPSHAEPIRTLFARYNVIYLYGHMHKVWGKPEYANGSAFMTIQAGASFQAGEASQWKNSILWGRANLVKKSLALIPFTWNFDEQIWKLNSNGFPEEHRIHDEWHFHLPQPFAPVDAQAPKRITPPGGWEIARFEVLQGYIKPIPEELAIYFFDGASPTWEVSLSTSIPRREIVGEIVSTYNKLVAKGSGLPCVCTLLAAGCEGKTTALLQASYEVLQQEPSKRILHRKNNLRPFDVENLLPVLSTHNNWLIVVDEADQVAKHIQGFAEAGLSGYTGRIDFLLACRDSDWRSNGADTIPWNFSCTYKEIVLKDLNKTDAEKIIHAWEAFGDRGLGEGGLANLDTTSRVEKLRFFAKQESRSKSGAFFGALLLSRHNGKLLDHAGEMLSRLEEAEVSLGKTLRDALAYIAAMHAEGFEKLTYDVLAAAMGMTISKLKNVVINKLGQEAAATGTATTIYTRHKYIAEAIIEVLEEKFEVDTASLFIDLALAAEEKSKTERVENLEFWRFKMADTFFENGKNTVATSLSRALLETDTSNYKLLTKLASFYRKENSPDDALVLFRNYDGALPERGFYYEWSLCELEARNTVESAALVLFSISDDTDASQLDIHTALSYLVGLTDILSTLHRDYADEIFVNASDAAWSIINWFVIPRPDLYPVGLKAFLNKVDKKRATLYKGIEAHNMLITLSARIGSYKSQLTLPQNCRVQHLLFDSLKMLIKNASR
ncbi:MULTISPECIES: metallophosphoesterase [unclassified Pseudomonas]|uniref:metallophosphoesterase family protein n=1 Tax=unclassified Pseudomonas TaxID=196821 RepID=UPI002446B8BA|nr:MULTISPECIES: metallophosphoesterase [unclassified Pseudomonas]MDG9926525.1 metallophosphoesterase [Pseudomonas sp. GD04042]MDH0481391.1 metallophosphoesterase [Pseudomonas sp. GD04015]MDH0603340.1 metallophosphoesterase [Pseudomonas sp. GD03869]